MIMLLLIFGIMVPAGAQPLDVDQIFDRVEENQVKFDNSKTHGEMILIDENGDKEIREIIMFEKDEEDDEITMLMRFLSPSSVEGVTLLSIKNGEKMYLYMPAYQKPRRIAGTSKQENFMGTDFSYEDLSLDYQSAEYQKKLLEELDEQYMIEVIPDEDEVSYKKFIVYVNKKDFYVEEVEFYNLNEEKTKTLQIKEIKKDEEGKITPIVLEINNLKENHQTRMNIQEIEYDLDLSSSFFSIRTLRKPRL